MKTWMKYLMWFGLGGGFGFFIGQQVGKKQTEEEYEAAQEVPVESDDQQYGSIEEILDEYIGEPVEDEDPDMPTEKDIEIDPDIPQLHPEHLVPEIIGEEEYNANVWGYDLENLTFYELDEVLYDETTQDIVANPDDVIGIGTLFEFGGDPNNPTETIYVKNDTYGTLFRIDRIDAAFCDAVDGTCGPEDDDEEYSEE